MTELMIGLDAPSDAELISRVRAGDVDAYGDLFARHVDAARRLARQLSRGPDADDLVSDAFTKVMGVLRGGGGPDVAFRAYLLTAVRRLHVDRIRSQSRLTIAEDMSEFDPGLPFKDTAVEEFESGAAAKAFASLPERWQLVLWHLEVEGQKPAEVAPLLGMTPNSVSALAYRAREGLRQAFLSAHLADTTDADCRWVTERLGGHVRNGLAKRDSARVESHLVDCRTCTSMYLELTEVNSNLSGIIGPLLLGSLATGYGATVVAGGGATGLVLLLDRVKDFALANMAPVAAAGTAAAGVATATALGVVVAGGHGIIPMLPGAPSVAETVAPVDELVTPPGELRASTVLPEDVSPVAAIASEPVPVDLLTQSPLPADAAPPDVLVPGFRVHSASVADNALVIDVQGLPTPSVAVDVRVGSSSGSTTFAVGAFGPCDVNQDELARAVCTVPVAAGEPVDGVLVPAGIQAVIPLAYPEDLVSDQLTVSVAIEGYADPDTTDNQLDLEFTPLRPLPTDPVPTDPAPTDPLPTDPAPTDPAPTDPLPTDPAPTDPLPTDPARTEPPPTDPTPTDPMPTDPIPTDPAPTDLVPSVTAPTDTAPIESGSGGPAQDPLADRARPGRR